MPYAIVPFYGTLSFYSILLSWSSHLFFSVFFFCSTHCTFWFTLYNTSDVCVDLKFSLWYVCTYDNLHTNTHIQAQAINSFKFLALWFIMYATCFPSSSSLCACVCDITNLDPDYTRYVVSGALWFDVRFTFCHSKLLVFFSLFLLAMESVF